MRNESIPGIAIILVSLGQEFAVLISKKPVTRWCERKSSSASVRFSKLYSIFGALAASGIGSGVAAFASV